MHFRDTCYEIHGFLPRIVNLAATGEEVRSTDVLPPTSTCQFALSDEEYA